MKRHLNEDAEILAANYGDEFPQEGLHFVLRDQRVYIIDDLALTNFSFSAAKVRLHAGPETLPAQLRQMANARSAASAIPADGLTIRTALALAEPADFPVIFLQQSAIYASADLAAVQTRPARLIRELDMLRDALADSAGRNRFALHTPSSGAKDSSSPLNSVQRVRQEEDTPEEATAQTGASK